MLAEMFLLSGQFAEALPQYQGVLASDPNWFNALLDAGRAAEALSEREVAANYSAPCWRIAVARMARRWWHCAMRRWLLTKWRCDRLLGTRMQTMGTKLLSARVVLAAH
jgi:hypothetical protein